MADARERTQVELILQDREGQIAAHPEGWRDGTLSYLYRTDTILIRAADEGLVTAVLNELQTRPRREGSEDLDRVGPRDVVALNVDVPGEYRERGGLIGLLDDVGARIGVGRARPEHLLYVCGHPCPATEPEEVSGRSQPTHQWPHHHPTHGGGCCCRRADAGPGSDGWGVSMLCFYTGLDHPTAASTPWLADATGDQDPAVGGGVIGAYGGHGTFAAGCARVIAPRADVHVSDALIPAIGAEFERVVARKIAEALDDLVDRLTPDILVYTFATKTHRDAGLMAFDALYDERLSTMKGLAVLAPAGNDGWSERMYPAAYPWVGSVGALDASGTGRAQYSNRGPWVDVWAPGTDLVNAFASGTFTTTETQPPEQRTFQGMARWSGTSFATPTVAGMVAARASARSMSAAAAWQDLLAEARASAVPGTGPVLVP